MQAVVNASVRTEGDAWGGDSESEAEAEPSYLPMDIDGFDEEAAGAFFPEAETPSQPVESINEMGGPTGGKKAHNKKRGHANRRNRRKKQSAQNREDLLYKAGPSAKHFKAAEPLVGRFEVKDLATTANGYTAPRNKPGSVHKLEYFLNRGFELVEWDGRTPRPIVDQEGLIHTLLAGQPADPEWDSVQMSAFNALQEGRERCDFARDDLQHQRGNFPALNYGISFGMGQKRPQNLQQNKSNTEVLEGLLKTESFIRIAGFCSSVFSQWSPRLYELYRNNMLALMEKYDDLRRNFTGSVWASAAFNFGPRTVTCRHQDSANLPYGWCSITSLGRFNPKKGGHLILWPLKLIIEFPPGSTVMIPSASMAHSNTPIGQDEARCSFTQYSAGGLFRWVDQGFQTTKSFRDGMTAEEMLEELERQRERCERGLKLFSTEKELFESK